MTKTFSKLSKICTKTNNCIPSLFIREKHVWSEDKVVKSPYTNITVPNITVYEYVWRNLDKWPTKTAAICGVTNRGYTYEQIYKKSQILGANLRKKFKINDGDTVAVMLSNVPEFPIIVYGILAAGGIVTTLNPIYTSHEVQRQITMSEAKLIVVNPNIFPTVKEALKLSKNSIPIVNLDINGETVKGTISYRELVDDVHTDLSILRQVRREAGDVSFLPYSSGTTGLPKGVELTNKAIVANFEQQNTEVKPFSDTTASNQDSLLLVLPMFHFYGLSILMLHKMSVGLKLVTVPKFQPETFLNSLLQYRINLLYLAPPLVLFLGSHPQVSTKHFENLKTVTSGAAPLAEVDIFKFFDKAGRELQFVQGYGLTETGPLATISVPTSKDYTSVGCALSNSELRVVNGEFNNLGPDETGELLIKGPNIMKGYKNNPEANRQVFLEDGWFRSGDLATIDGNGVVRIADRLKELIKVNAYQVPPAELENVIKEHPAVFDAAVVGIPDSVTGENPKAFVVLKQGVKVKDKDIIEFVSERVAPYKKVKEVSFVESIPKNPAGKILRRVLKEKYC